MNTIQSIALRFYRFAFRYSRAPDALVDFDGRRHSGPFMVVRTPPGVRGVHWETDAAEHWEREGWSVLYYPSRKGPPK